MVGFNSFLISCLGEIYACDASQAHWKTESTDSRLKFPIKIFALKNYSASVTEKMALNHTISQEIGNFILQEKLGEMNCQTQRIQVGTVELGSQ